MDVEAMSSPLHMAAVVIGRNEGERLQPSLRSVLDAGLPLVYVDSGSSDCSVAVARSLGIPVVELDPSRPFSAGRGRNEGLIEAQRLWPGTEYVLFLDGDCILEPGFPAAAAATFQSEADCAIVTGHLSERFPDRSVYNRLCAIEWRSPPGRMQNMNALGGIMAARVSAFLSMGGFNLTAIAGEEPDLGARLLLAGHSVVKIDEPMATHDAQMLRFSQWWKRALRGGHAIAHRYASHGRSKLRDGGRELRSALFWGFLLPLLIVALLWPTRGLSLFLLAGYPYLGWRIYRYYSRTGLSRSDALLVARFIVYAKVPEFLGIVRYGLNRARGRFHIIEYK
jgi:glycosyltransferase involved in cell wall biosynthesis